MDSFERDRLKLKSRNRTDDVSEEAFIRVRNSLVRRLDKTDVSLYIDSAWIPEDSPKSQISCLLSHVDDPDNFQGWWVEEAIGECGEFLYAGDEYLVSCSPDTNWSDIELVGDKWKVDILIEVERVCIDD